MRLARSKKDGASCDGGKGKVYGEKLLHERALDYL